MIPRSVKAPTIPIPFHKLLKVVAVVDRDNPQTQQLLDLIRAEGFEVEVCDSFDRDVSEDASVGAYIALVDGERREPARAAGARGARAGLPDAAVGAGGFAPHLRHAVLGMTGEVDGYIYLGQQTPEFYAKQVIASLVEYGMSLLPPFFGGLMAYDARGQHRLRLPRPPGRPVLPQVAGRAAVLQALRREHLPQRPVQRRRRPRRPADPRRRRRRRRRSTRRRSSAPTAPTSC